MGATVRLEVEGAIATIRLDRPPANVLGTPEAAALAGIVAELTDRDDARAVVVWGGERTFSAGADLKELSAAAGPDEARSIAGALGDALLALEGLPLVTVAAIEGAALGGGLELALACDLRIASEAATLGLPEVTLGIMPGAGGTQRLPRAVGHDRARELVLTGRRIPAAEAHAFGLVHALAPAGDALAAASEIARSFAEGPTRAYAAAKAALRAAGGDLRPGLALELDAFGALFSTEDRREGMTAFAEKRPPRFAGR